MQQRTFTWEDCKAFVQCVQEVQSRSVGSMEVDIDWLQVFDQAKKMSSLQGIVTDANHCYRLWNTIAYNEDYFRRRKSSNLKPNFEVISEKGNPYNTILIKKTHF